MAAVSLQPPPADSSQSLGTGRKPRAARRGKRGLIAMAVGLVLIYFAPALVAITSLRDIPLRMVFEGIDGTIRSDAVSLGWFSAVEYRGVEVHDLDGSLVVSVPTVTVDRTVLQLAFDRATLGKVTLQEPAIHVVARADGSNAEDVFLPWWELPSSGPIEMELDVVDGTIRLDDQVARTSYQFAALAASLRLALDEQAPIVWSASGNVNDGQRAGKFAASSADESEGAIRLQAEHLPLAMFRWLAGRGYGDVNLAGELACDLTWQPTGAASTEPTAAPADGVRTSAEESSIRGRMGLSNLLLSGGPLAGDTLRLANLTIESDLALAGERLKVRQLAVDCDLGRVAAQGDLAARVPGDAAELAALARDRFRMEGSLDLAQLCRMLPRTLHVRKDTEITAGVVRWTLASEPAAAEHRWQARLETSGLAATSAGKNLHWEKPVTIELAARETPAGLAIDSLACSSDFLRLTGQGTADNLTAELSFDLDRLKAELGQLIDLGNMQLAGDGRAQLHWQRDAAGAFRTTAAARLQNVQFGTSAKATWREADLTAELQAAGRMPAATIERIERAELQVMAAGQAGAGDQLEVHLREPIAMRTSGDKSFAFDRLPVLLHASGDVGRWRMRLAPLVSIAGWDLRGTADVHANATWTPAAWELNSLQGTIQQLHAWNGTWFIDESVVKFDSAARYDAATQRIEVTKATIEMGAASLKTDQASIAFSHSGSLGLLGEIAFVANLESLQRWTRDPKQPTPIVWRGQMNGRANLALDGDVTSAQLDTVIDNLAAVSTTAAATANVGPGNPLRAVSAANPLAGRAPLWEEQKLTLAMQASYSRKDDTVQLAGLHIGSGALKLDAAGQIAALSDKADIDLRGQVEYDWSRLSKLLTPYLGDELRVEGRDTREFAVRGPIGGLIRAGKPASANQASVTPAAAASSKPADPLSWLKPLSAQAGVGWQRADAYGLTVGKGEIAADLRDGLLKVQPIDLAVSEGRVRLSPQVLLTPAPAVLTHGRGKLIERVRVSPAMTRTWLKFIAPAVAEATETQGELSLELNGAKVPLFKPETAQVSGRLEIHSLQVTPGPTARAVVLLAEQIRALVERRPPPMELGRNPTLLTISGQQIDFGMTDGRVHHQGMTMNVGNVTIRTHGWVAIDESISLVADVPIKAEWFGGGGMPASMQDQTLQIPIGGTLRQPRVDPRAWQQVVALFAQTAARDLIQDQLNKGLDRLFQER